MANLSQYLDKDYDVQPNEVIRLLDDTSGYLPLDGSILNIVDYPIIHDAIGTIIRDDIPVFTSVTSGTTSTIRCMTYSQAQNLYVAAGSGGHLRTSTNGITWTARTSGITGVIYDVFYDDALNIFLYAAQGGVIRTSTNGITWTARTSGTTWTRFFVGRVNDKFFSTGTNGVVRTSTDGITWTGVTLPSQIGGSNNYCWNVCYGNNIYILITNNASGAGEVGRYFHTSTDGITWSDKTFGFAIGGGAGPYEIIFSDRLGKFYAVGDYSPLSNETTDAKASNVLESKDGVNWNRLEIGTTQTILSVNDIGGKLILNGATGTLVTSTDGITWDIQTSGHSNLIYDALWDGRYYLVGGVGGYIGRADYLNYDPSTQFKLLNKPGFYVKT